jgi:hypothetical protein
VNCRNHPETPATHSAEMPVSTKQPDGSYIEAVPLCGPCAERINTIGFRITPSEEQRVTERASDRATTATVPRLLTAGAVIRSRDGDLRVLAKRKDDDSGWWLSDGSGLDDEIWEAGDWTADEQPLLGLATTRALLSELATRMEITQNSTNGRELGRLCRGALANLDRGVLDYRPVSA